MATGRILINGRMGGCGFVLATPRAETSRIALTAKHVIGNHEAASLQFVTGIEQKISVASVQGDDDLDVAVLHLEAGVPGGLAVARAVEDAAWRVETQPLNNDPELTGTVQVVDHPFRKSQGQHDITVLQLLVTQELDQYRGYSGSPVVLKAPPGQVIGMLLEQVLSRLAATEVGQSRRATNVLYALPLVDVLDRFAMAYDLVEARATTRTLSTLRVRRLNTAGSDPLLPPCEIETHKRLITLGRAPRSTVPIQEDSVSWEHGQIVFEQGEYVYRHLSRSSRTLLISRGQEQTFRPGKGEEAVLHNQDRLLIGRTTFIVEFDLLNEDSDYKPTADTPEDAHAS